jgi:hypothetical protein
MFKPIARTNMGLKTIAGGEQESFFVRNLFVCTMPMMINADKHTDNFNIRPVWNPSSHKNVTNSCYTTFFPLQPFFSTLSPSFYGRKHPRAMNNIPLHYEKRKKN